MTREEAFTNCPPGSPDSYVAFYGGEWLIIPYEPVTQPPFFNITPRLVA